MDQEKIKKYDFFLKRLIFIKGYKWKLIILSAITLIFYILVC